MGSVNQLLPIPGVSEHAHGFRGIPEALYLRDHLTRQSSWPRPPPTRAERHRPPPRSWCGRGLHRHRGRRAGRLFTAALRDGSRSAPQPLRWMLLDLAERVLPELDPRLSTTADAVLRGRGIQVRIGTSVEAATADGVWLSDGRSCRPAP